MTKAESSAVPSAAEQDQSSSIGPRMPAGGFVVGGNGSAEDDDSDSDSDEFLDLDDELLENMDHDQLMQLLGSRMIMQGPQLPAPIENKHIDWLGDSHFRIASAGMHGCRETMEDAHCLQLQLSAKHPRTAFFGVYDGHVGDQCSEMLGRECHTRVGELDDLSEAAISKVLTDLDTEFCRQDNQHRLHGSTCVFALVDRPDSDQGEIFDITTVNVGDSRILLGKADGKSFEFLTRDHKPTDGPEMARIQKAGGFVQAERVDGNLALSRAFGDANYKQSAGIARSEQKVIADPEFKTTMAQKGDWLLVACDGLFEHLSNAEIAEFVHQDLAATKRDARETAANLCNHALESGSQDNMTATVILFEDGSDWGSEPQRLFKAGPLYEQQDNPHFLRKYLQDAALSGLKDGKALRTLGYEADRALVAAKDRELLDAINALPQDASSSVSSKRTLSASDDANRQNQPPAKKAKSGQQ